MQTTVTRMINAQYSKVTMRMNLTLPAVPRPAAFYNCVPAHAPNADDAA